MYENMFIHYTWEDLKIRKRLKLFAYRVIIIKEAEINQDDFSFRQKIIYGGMHYVMGQ